MIAERRPADFKNRLYRPRKLLPVSLFPVGFLLSRSSGFSTTVGEPI